MTNAILLIVVIFFMALNENIQGNTLQRTVEGLKSNDKSILRASHSLLGGIPIIKKEDEEIEGTKTSDRIIGKNYESTGRDRKKRSLTWRGSIIRGLKIKLKLKTKNVKVCTVVLAYTLRNKCKILRIRLK